jgi:hypothetical protein
MKIRPMGAELFPADGQTDMKNLIVAFWNFANAPKNNARFLTTDEKSLNKRYARRYNSEQVDQLNFDFNIVNHRCICRLQRTGIYQPEGYL